MAFQVKNIRQALDALAYYSAKEAVRQLTRPDGSLPSYDAALDLAYVIAHKDSAANGIFTASVNRHLPKFLKVK